MSGREDEFIDPKSTTSNQLSNFQLVRHKAILTPEVLGHPWSGNGTEEDPYLVEWLADDPRNPMNFPQGKKWAYTILVSLSCLCVAFTSSAYAGGISEIMLEFQVGNVVAFLGISLFLSGFCIGPLFWAPLSEIYGRQNLFIATYGMLVIFNAAGTGAHSIVQLIVFRFMAGAFGSSPLTNAGGVIADMFPSANRGLATTIFACGPFLGPILGPIVGGFVGESAGWRWVMALMTIATAMIYIPCCVLIPETYGPVLLRLRARKLSKETGSVYLSRLDFIRGPMTVAATFKKALSRPLIILTCEPIVLIISIYMAIVYGTMYMLFAAFPIVFRTGRGWSAGMSGLAFVGIAVGMFGGCGWMVWENTRYVRKGAKYPNGRAPPEARLPPCMVGAALIPIGLFWFAWTNSTSTHWIVCIVGSSSFGFGMVLVYLSCMNYLVDTYVIYAASCLAGSAVIRAIFGAVFPLFTPKMYSSLGLHWASSVPAFMALLCAPFPFIFYRYGAGIRAKGKYAAEAAKELENLYKVAEIKGVLIGVAGVEEKDQRGKADVLVEERAKEVV